MAASNRNECLRLVFGEEGGFVNNPKDPGRATRWGVTIKTLSAWRGKPVTVADVRNLSLDEAGQILDKQYWHPVGGDDLPAGVDLALFDFAVNSGPAQAVRTAQRIVGVSVDGIMGTKTLAAIRAMPEAVLIRSLSSARLGFMKKLSTWPTFGKGWTNRVNRIEATALKMLDQPRVVASLPGPAPEDAGHAAADPADRPATATPQGKASATVIIGSIGTAASTAAQQLSAYTEAAAIVKWLFLGLTIVGALAAMYVTIKHIAEGQPA